MNPGAIQSPNTVAKAYRLLARILDTVVEAGLIARNPCSVKGAATERAAEMRVATVAQVAALAEAIQPTVPGAGVGGRLRRAALEGTRRPARQAASTCSIRGLQWRSR